MTDTQHLVKKIRIIRDLPPPAIRRALRVGAGLTEKDIASVLGVTHVTVSRYELGKRTPRGTVLAAYVEVLRTLARETSP